MQNEKVYQIVKAALWDDNIMVSPAIDQSAFDELIDHCIFTLPGYILSNIQMPDDMRNKWSKLILQHISYYHNYLYVQSLLPITVPFVILKGSAAAQYYPHPELRMMGDIDIITSRDNYEQACNDLSTNGYKEITMPIQEEYGRHRTFIKNGISIEIHAYFALLNNIEEAQYFDELIISNINATHYLPDLINGLVILEHISQHLEKGIGLRQILDWMMFVDKCLTNEKWNDFARMSTKIGLEKLAIVITRMCELYLGLAKKEWTKQTNDYDAERLMEYVMEAGNFGKKESRSNNTELNVFMIARTPKATFRLLQERGRINWRAAQKYKFLEKIAWIYQICRYMIKGFKQKSGIQKIKTDYLKARATDRLFEDLGVKRGSKGIVIFHDGQYIKTDKSI